MATAREALEGVSVNLEESMGVRTTDFQPTLAPVSQGKDAGRSPNRKFGKLRIENVIADPDQPRSDFPDDTLDRLVQSIREKGQLTPVRVRWAEEHQRWVIVFGERRWRAARRAGLTEIDCFFHESPLSTSEILEQQLIENCLREDLQPIEEARAFAKLVEMNGWTGKQLAESLRIPPSRVSRAFALLRLPSDVQERVEAGEVPARAAYELSKLDNPEAQREIASRVAAGALSVEQAARTVMQRQGKPKDKPRGTRQTFITEDGWKVLVSARKKGTYHEVARALELALDEVRHRIDNGKTLF